jgi:hypothetical protein
MTGAEGWPPAARGRDAIPVRPGGNRHESAQGPYGGRLDGSQLVAVTRSLNHGAKAEPEEAMFEQLFGRYRKTSEACMQMQQDMFRSLMQQWMAASPNAAGAAADWNRHLQKRLFDLAVELLNRQRQSLDANYRSAIEILEQSAHLSESKSAEEYRRGVEDLWHRWFETVKTQSESQFRDLQNWAGKSLEIVQSAQV